jgi:hypothetical protein
VTVNNAINANAATPLSSANGGTGLSSPTAGNILIAQGASPFTTVNLTSGQLLVGTTSGSPVATTVTAGTGISRTGGSGTLTIANTQPAEAWTDVTGTSATMSVNNAYTASNAGVVTFNLPATAAMGTIQQVMTGTTSGGWKIAQSAGQSIKFGTLSTTSGTGGSLASTAQGDGVILVCNLANLSWTLLSSVGNIAVT